MSLFELTDHLNTCVRVTQPSFPFPNPRKKVTSTKITIFRQPHSQSTMSSAVVTPLQFPEDSNVKFGASISNIDLENLSGKTKIVMSCEA